MGTPKKKHITKSPSPSILIPGRDFDVDALVKLTDDTRKLADDYETVIENLSPETTCPQRVMRTALLGSPLAEQAGRFGSLFKSFAVTHRGGTGGFMHEAEVGSPLVVISFPSTGGAITPKWKEEAFRLGEELAKVKGDAFDTETFEKEIRARYQPGKIGTSVSLAEAG